MNLEEANIIMEKYRSCATCDITLHTDSCKDCGNYVTDKAVEEAMKVINPKPDNVNNPKHYAGSCSIECIDAMQMAYGSQVVHNFCICNAFKYLWRHKNKNGAEDLNKAEWYINKAEELTKIHTPIINDLRTILEKYREKFESSNE